MHLLLYLNHTCIAIDVGPGPAAYPQMDEWRSLYPDDQAFQYSFGARRW